MRSAKASDMFPYSSKLVCYIELSGDGKISQIDTSYESVADAYERAASDKSTIYAVWPGRWSSDLFIVDDLDAFADAFGIPRPDSHKHDIFWKLSSIDDGISRYARVDIIFSCGCEINDNNIIKIARDLREQMGWDMAMSTGWGMHSDENGDEYSISVRRSSLK
jgi:hypothetical protein